MKSLHVLVALACAVYGRVDAFGNSIALKTKVTNVPPKQCQNQKQHLAQSRPTSYPPPTMLSMSSNDDGGKSTNPSFGKLPIRTVALSVLGLFSAINLSTEIPQILSGYDRADYIGTGLDIFLLGYAVQNVLRQIGVVKSEPDVMSAASLDGFECCVTVNVGRERGTWMDKDWAASGARLVFPINIRFSGDELDLGSPGEEGLGGRYCKRLEILNSENDPKPSFVGPNGAETVHIESGGWAVLPITERKAGSSVGAFKLRFFLDFPSGASRNDVSIPAGRVFFSGICLEDISTAGFSEMLKDVSSTSILSGPGTTGVLADGGMTIKKNNWANLYGALGDVNLILGRYGISPVKKSRKDD